RMDDVIYEEFKGTGNMELHLDRGLAERRIFPAIDILRSGTRKEELLVDKDHLDKMWAIRKTIQDSHDFFERFLRRLKASESNEERSEEHTSELQSRFDLVCRLLLEKNKRNVRVRAELGADLIETNWSVDDESYSRLVQCANGVQVGLAGPPSIPDRDLLQPQDEAMS